MNSKQRNTTIVVAAILLLLWYRSKKKEELGAPEEQNAGGGGGGGGFMGGGLGIGLPIVPVIPIAQTPTPPVPTPTTPTTPLETTQSPASAPVKGGVQDPTGVIIPANPSFWDAIAIRPLQFQNSTGILMKFNKGDILKAAYIQGSTKTYPQLNPKATLILGVDIDWAKSPTGGIIPPTGGVLGGTTSGGTTTGGVATGGLASGATTGGQIKL